MHAPSTHRRCAVSTQVLLAVLSLQAQCLGPQGHSCQTGGGSPATATSCDAGHRASLAQMAVDGQQQCRRVEACAHARQPHPTTQCDVDSSEEIAHAPRRTHAHTSTPTTRGVGLLAVNASYILRVARWELACAKEKAKTNGSVGVSGSVCSHNCVHKELSFCDGLLELPYFHVC